MPLTYAISPTPPCPRPSWYAIVEHPDQEVTMNAIDYATDPRAAALSVLATVRALLSPFGYDQHPNHAWREDGFLTPEGERQAQQALDLSQRLRACLGR